jgi:hypothetical protein
MTGIAQNQYPYIVFESQEKKLWNPLTKKKLVLRPEELVRLQWIEAFIHLFGISKSRISTEEAVLTQFKESTLRADLVIYDQAFKPFILVECKSNQVELSDKTALQAGVYNSKIDAPFILITNGFHDLWFEKADPFWKNLTKPPLRMLSKLEDHDADYWIQRGFLGKLIDRERIKQLLPFMQKSFLNPNHLVRYRTFSQAPDNLNMNHYYATFSFNENIYHTSLLSDYRGKTSWWILVTKNGINEKLIYVDVDAAFADIRPNMWVYQRGKQTKSSLPSTFFIQINPFDSPEQICHTLVNQSLTS